MQRRIILASTSPRRIEILKKTDLHFEIVAPRYEEEMHLALAPAELATYLARKKAQSVAADFPDALIIGADTLVVLGDEIFGKPKTPQRAKEMLRELSGKTHRIITGFSILDTKTGTSVTESDVSSIKADSISESSIDEYVATGEPLDKAGGYAIQGGASAFMKLVEGDIDSVMGLPLKKILAVLKEL